MGVDMMVLKCAGGDLNQRLASKFRGFVAGKYPEWDMLHNHGSQGTIYRYPQIQYKIVHGVPIIVAIEDGIPFLRVVANDLDCLNLEGNMYSIENKEIYESSEDVEVSDDMLLYDFITPWMALNQKNSPIYNKSDRVQKVKLLEKILIGNLLTLSKALNYKVEETLQVRVYLEPCTIGFKNNLMNGFKGSFETNLILPDYLGVGKSVARGFGTIMKR